MPGFMEGLRGLGKRMGRAFSRAEQVVPEAARVFPEGDARRLLSEVAQGGPGNALMIREPLESEIAAEIAHARKIRALKTVGILGGGGAAVGAGAGYLGGSYANGVQDGHSVDLLGHNLTVGSNGMRWS